jgi:hypothetical protein
MRIGGLAIAAWAVMFFVVVVGAVYYYLHDALAVLTVALQ